MKQVKVILKWIGFNGAWVALAWAGYEQGHIWCQNIFAFMTWFIFVMSGFAMAMIGIIKHLIEKGDFDGSAQLNFNEKVVDSFQVPVIFNLVLDAVMIAYLASHAFYVFATVVAITALFQSVTRSFIKDLKLLASEYLERRRNAPVVQVVSPVGGNNDPWDTTEPTFTDDEDNELFRMGITTREREE